MPQTVPVPDYVSEAARRGLEWHAEGKSGDGVTDQTIREARDMVEGSISEDKVRRMGPWFQRHRGDMDAPKNKPDNEDFPGAGAVAWALWGGPTSGDIMRTAKWAEEEASRLDREDEEDDSASAKLPAPAIFKTMTIEEKLVAAEALVASASAERDDLRVTLENLTVGASSEVEALKVEASAKDAKLVELEGLLAASAKQVEELTAKVAELSAVQISASAEAAAIVAKVGVAAVDLPQGDSPVRASDKEIAEQYAAMPAGPERLAFLKKNRAAIFKSA